MEKILDYQIVDELYESGTTLVLRAKRQGTGSVILKILKSEKQSNEEIQCYHNEYTLTRSLKHLSKVINTYGLERDKKRGSLVMLMEDIGAVSLDKLLVQSRFTVQETLEIAVAVIDGLDEIHRAGIIHKDINPSNIIMNPDSRQVRLIDFGIAVSTRRIKKTAENDPLVEGTLAYIPPEQTGRIDRAIDHRADFYAFGATLYELLAHKPPFSTGDHVDLIHCHLAQKPVALSSIRDDIPGALSAIVMKMLNKAPEERYATAGAVRADLSNCLDRLKKGERYFSFPPGEKDRGRTLRISNKIYGRQKEVKQLQSIFRKVRSGEKRVVFVKGRAGVGKTVLTRELENYTQHHKGIFIGGKFDRIKKSIPYTGIIQAFRRLAHYLLTRDDAELADWKRKLGEVIGNSGSEIIDWVPEFEKIIGPKSFPPGLGGQEARNRFYLTFENFLGVFATKQRPFVFFLDDLQWIDPSSLVLLQRMLLSPIIDNLLIIAAFRDDEVTPQHPLWALFKTLEVKKVAYHEIQLTPLDMATFCRMVADYLECPPAMVHSLAQWVHTRSLGNPFHGQKLLTFLSEKGSLRYDTGQDRWQWNVDDIQSLALPRSIADLLAGKLETLSRTTRKVLMRAAALGATFDLNTLAIICERFREEVEKVLEHAVQAGLILRHPVNVEPAAVKGTSAAGIMYSFVHDRIHEAAYTLIPVSSRAEFHQNIGQLLQRKLSVDQRAARLFEVVNHLNHGRALRKRRLAKKELASHNLEAGRKAKAASAFGQAYSFFKIGIELLNRNDPDNDSNRHHLWQPPDTLIRQLYLGAIEAAYLGGRFEEGDQLGQTFIAKCGVAADRLYYYNLKVQACYAQNLMEEAVATALHALKSAGIHIDSNPSRLQIVLEYLKTGLTLAGKSTDKLANLPATSNPEKMTILDIMHNTLLPSYNVNANLFPMLVFKAIRVAVRYGSTANSAFAFSGYGMILSCFMGKMEKGYQYGLLATKMMAAFENKELGAKTLVTVSIFTTHWKKHLSQVSSLLHRAYKMGVENGDFQFGAIAAHTELYYRFFLGENLKALYKKGVTRNKAINRLKQKTILLYHNIFLESVNNLIEPTQTPCKLSGRHYDETSMLSDHLAAKDGGALFKLYLQKTILCYLFDRTKEAVDYAREAKKYLTAQRGGATVQYYFYCSLSILADKDSLAAGEWGAQVQENQKKMKRWAKNAPMNYAHKYQLVEAELSRVNQAPQKAARLYDLAIKNAQREGFVHESALANEAAGRFYLNSANPAKGREYLQQAHHDYLKWGAGTKLTHLEARYPEIFPAKNAMSVSGFSSNPQMTVKASGKTLDLNAVLEASLSISSEIHFEQLIEKLMRIVIKNTGAQKGVLFLKKNGVLAATAVYPSPSANYNGSHSVSNKTASGLPKSVIHYVERLEESIILNANDTDPAFKSDPYIAAWHPKSLLCFPLHYKAKLMGIIYLENRQVAGTFTPHSLEMLKVLSAQICVSLENARLYNELSGQARQLKSVNLKLQREIDHRLKVEQQLLKYRDQLKQDLDAQTAELIKSKQTLASLETDVDRRHRFRNLIGKNERMQRVYRLIEELADVNANVLITGESGTGKELVAEALHTESRRKKHPFVKVNCSALSESVLESELFGHVKGAFTGADKNRVGRFQKAADGTIFLDEIGDVSLNFQKRLLRVLQEREFERLGDTSPLPMDARVIAATNQNLVSKVKKGTFRQDLYYRLKVVELKLPPLRERKEDIPLLIHHFLTLFNGELEKKIKGVSPEVLRILMAYHWPGNVRELRNTLEHICILCKKSTVVKKDLPPDFSRHGRALVPSLKTLSNGGEAPDADIQANDKERLLRVLEQTQWNKTRAAELLGISRRTLYRRLKTFNL